MEEVKLHRLDIIKEGFYNTKRFSPAAQYFVESGFKDDDRSYCPSPVGTSGHKEFWDEEERRCIFGYEVDGIRITGKHYWYLNFCRIKVTIEDKKRKLKRKVLTFPKFLDIDYYYFHEVEKARIDGEGLIVAKSRRKGFSFKNAALCSWSFTFERESQSIIGGYLEKYAKKTMDMAIEMLNFNLKHTNFGMNRHINKRDEIESGFVEDGITQGFRSRMDRYTFKDNSSAVIGDSADLMLFEEAGKWRNLIDSHSLTSPLFKDGNERTGLEIIFGTGGDMEVGSVDFATMFYDPKTADLRCYDNVWDLGAEGTPCGLFIDDMWYKPGAVLIPKEYEHTPFAPAPTSEEVEDFQRKYPDDMIMVNGVDEDGNSHRCAAEIELNRERAAKRKTATKKTWEGFITQYPKTPKEAFLVTSGNVFPTAELNAWLGKIETSGKFRDARQVGHLYSSDEGTIKWMPDASCRPVDKFPHDIKEDNKGSIVIWEHPYKDQNGKTPHGLYIAGTDPYDQDTSSTSSLGSTFVYKQMQKFDETYNIVVAEYTGRPETSKEYYENVRKLLTYYNAKDLYENQLTGLKTYFEQKRCLHLLKEQPTIISNIIKRSVVNRGYGVHMTQGIKKQAEIYLRDWLLEARGTNEDGESILNLHTLLSVPLIKELISYDPDKGNFDRVIGMMLIVLHMQDNHNVKVKKQANDFRNNKTGIFNPTKRMFPKKGQSRYKNRLE